MSVLSSIIKKFFSSPNKKEIDFRPSLFRDKDVEFLDVPPKVPHHLHSGVVSSGFTASTLKQTLDDAKNVRATALKNAQQALTSAFDLHGVKPAEQIYKPGFKITVLDDCDDIGDFDDDMLDMGMGISGFMLNPSSPNANGRSYPNISFTSSIPLGTPTFHHATFKPPIDIFDTKPVDDLFKAGLPQLDSHGNPMPAALDNIITKVDFSRAVDEQPLPLSDTRTGKIARVEFDVVFGRPQWSNQIHAIKNSGGKEIYLASNNAIVRVAVKNFNDKVKEMYGDKMPVFTIESGTMFRTGLIDEAHPILTFRGLRFPNNGAKITAVFSYDSELNRKTDIDVIKKDIELIGTSCQFFVLGELELDELEESITDMVFESFGYNNPHRMNINKELFRIL